MNHLEQEAQEEQEEDDDDYGPSLPPPTMQQVKGPRKGRQGELQGRQAD